MALGQVADQSRTRIARVNIENIAASYAIPAVSGGVSIISDLENQPFDVLCVARQEIFDIATVHRLAAIEAEVWADRVQSPQVAEPNGFAPKGYQTRTQAS